jgi:hypothetical protein
MASQTSQPEPANAGTATITSFRYFKGLCFVTLSNGISGIIGDSVSMPLATMLTLKGQHISYEFRGTKGEYKQYTLGFAL